MYRQSIKKNKVQTILKRGIVTIGQTDSPKTKKAMEQCGSLCPKPSNHAFF